MISDFNEYDILGRTATAKDVAAARAIAEVEYEAPHSWGKLKEVE